jgi:lysozyme family protein
MSFQQAIEWLLSPDVEGTHSNDPADRGGDTWYGISRNAHPSIDWPPSREQAEAIYREQYWNACRCDELPPVLALLVFDAAVQHGTHMATRMLQTTIGAMPDGRIGPKTLSAAWRFSRENTVEFLSRRAKYYTDIVISDPRQHRFTRGWHRRLFLLQQFIQRGIA